MHTIYIVAYTLLLLYVLIRCAAEKLFGAAVCNINPRRTTVPLESVCLSVCQSVILCILSLLTSLRKHCVCIMDSLNTTR